MAEFIRSFMNLAFARKPAEGRVDDEQPANVASVPPSSMYGGTGTGTTATAVAFRRQSQVMRPSSRIGERDDDDDGAADLEPITLFRRLVGISADPRLNFGVHGPRTDPSRPGKNIGLYARVVGSEQTSSDKYRIYSAVINACFFLQIIIAAALTALGAAGANHSAITAFGAINTVIAGFLTFLKGSGLPGRLKYYGERWKDLREHIEQRERDFTRGGQSHAEVLAAVRDIENMYSATKMDIEANTPDGYNSRTMAAGGVVPAVGPGARASVNGPQLVVSPGGASVGGDPEKAGAGIDVQKIESTLGRIESYYSKAHSFMTGLEKKAADVNDGAHHLHDDEARLERQLSQRAGEGMRELGDRRARAEHDVSEAADHLARDAGSLARQESRHLAQHAADSLDRRIDKSLE